MSSNKWKTIQTLLESSLAELLDHGKNDYDDVQRWATKSAELAMEAIKSKEPEALAEVCDQALLIAEVARLRVSRKTKDLLDGFLKGALKVAVTLL